MNAAGEPRFLLLWKGRQSGPFTAAAIRERLGSGEISRMHQVQFNGRWIVLDDFLENHGGGDPEAKRRSDAEKRERKRRLDAVRLASPGRGRESGLDDFQSRRSLSHLLPVPFTEPEMPAVPAPDFPETFEPPEPPSRVSGLALAALALSLCNFVPYVNFVAWLPALACGHMALVEMKRDPLLSGRAMAFAGLLLTYFVIVAALTFAVLMLSHGQRIF